MSVQIGSVSLPAPLMTAAGTAGYGSELSAFMDLSAVGAVVVKSLSADEWAGNPAPRVHETPAGMLNSVGLQGPGVAAWRKHELPELIETGARVVVSIWGRSVQDYARAAKALQDCPKQVVAVEVNLSCPNLDGGTHLFAHDPVATAQVLHAISEIGLPLWAKLSPNTDRLVEVAAAAQEAGAEAVTLINTVLGMIIDTESRRPILGGGGGGLSGPAIRPVAVRAIHDVHMALPDLPIVGVGGCATAEDAVELMLAGASAVQIGTANFVQPSSVEQVQDDLRHWCFSHGVPRVSELTGGVKH
ncbi:MAG: dihydroorotate dehydrogenase [Actinobacteria bacterium]|nr:dihydroorotate dehydrogenase [Actinomycetota bacterium]MSV83912.1 dihydroorotate dehydrogenase [Actinomycetota bacterium]MSX74123.1 dihydroorotate dehydrogenase [Actinomycetota bacterium]MSY22051.1 dihydroorotate dehydrogenase [Actinomycetota bacterium]MTA73607.1 dihydroorotate dehydrogenase [Actinomycetota bacterium]